MAKVNFKRVQSVDDLSNLDIIDGNFIVTGDGKTYIDYGNERKGIGGTPDLEMSDTSTNSVQNKVIKEYIDNINDNVLSSIEEVENKTLKIGKQLWTGAFSTGSIIVPDISKYTLIAINVAGILCLGNQRYGGCVFTKYHTLETASYGYRYTYNSTNETLTVDTNNTGATDGTTRQTITEIYGIF